MDYHPPGITELLWYADIEGSLVAEEDCEYEIGMGVYGTANLYVNGSLLIDNTTVQRKGTMFFNCGTVEEKGILPMKKGETYNFKIEFGSAPSCKLDRGHNVLFGGGAVRLGGCKVIDPMEEIKKSAELAKEHDQVVICAGLNADWETEGADRADMSLPGHMDALIAAVSAANPNTVVVMQSGTPVEMPWISSVNGLLQAWYGGNETGHAIADVLFGDVCPSAKLPLSFPKRIQDNPAYLNYVTERGRVLYGEDVYIGYRWYEQLELPVLFPFGHGLSYTTFTYSDLKVVKTDTDLKVSVEVKNTGERSGAEVVQVYIAQKKPSIRRPKKELQGFKKVVLEKGESKVVEVTMELKYAASFWDEQRAAWIVEKDEYEVIVGGSSDDKNALKTSFVVEKTSWWNGL
jgi:beta-glucosidase